jgi:hypothetical protein
VQTIRVQDIAAPVITCPGDKLLNCPADTSVAANGSATATDACDSQVTISSSDELLPGNCPGNYSIRRTWTAVDDCGNRSQCVQTIRVQDITAPVITCPGDKLLDCPADTSVAANGSATATDACDNQVTISSSDETVPGNCPGNYTIRRTWTAVDDCGNRSQCVQTIRVQDTTAPVITCPGDKLLECSEDTGVGANGSATATDACDNQVTISSSDETVPGNCPGNYTIRRTWTAVDDCGNRSQCVQTIRVQDITAPVITCAAAISPVQCPAPPAFTDPIVNDACDPAPTVRFTDAIIPACGASYTITRTWTATDACGNSASCSQTIAVEDNRAPSIPDCPDNITVCAGDPVVLELPIGSDTCDDQVRLSVTRSDGKQLNDTFPLGTTTLTATLTDECGNSSSCVWTVTVTPCEQHCTFTQGYWGNNGGQGQATSRIQLINQLIGATPIVLGVPGRSLTITSADAACVVLRMPAGGPSAALTPGAHTFGGDCATDLPLDSRSRKFRNNLLGQSIALALNRRYDTSLGSLTLQPSFATVNGKDCKTFTIPQNVLNALNSLGLPRTVDGLLQLINRALGGQSMGGASLSDVASAAAAINEGFDECRTRSGTSCP